MKTRVMSLLISALLITSSSSLSAASPVKQNAKCTKYNQKVTVAKIKFKCVKSGKKLVWKKIAASSTPLPTASPTPTPTTSQPAMTVSQANAVAKAASYLRSLAFSRVGLIKQLEFEGFNNADATYGVDSQNVDWSIQAIAKAKSYLRSSAFSRVGLIKQMEFEGFSNSDAVYGVDAQNANWNEQAALKAKSYLRSSAFSRTGLIKQLEFEGFTTEQAIYGVSTTGL